MVDGDSEALAILRRIEPTLVRIEQEQRQQSERLVRIETIQPTLVTQADVAALPTRGELWALIAVLVVGLPLVLSSIPGLLLLWLSEHLGLG